MKIKPLTCMSYLYILQMKSVSEKTSRKKKTRTRKQEQENAIKQQSVEP